MVRSLLIVSTAATTALGQLTFEDKLMPDLTEYGGFFGGGLSQFEDTLVVGCPYDNDAAAQAGAAYVFERHHGAWVEVDKLTPPGGGYINKVASDTSIWEDTLVLGAPGHAGGGVAAGAVFIYERDARGEWIFDRKLQADDVGPSALFGSSVALRDDTLLVGATADDEGAENGGAVYVFHRVDGAWLQADKIIPDDLVEHDFFGMGLEFDGERFVAASHKNDDFILGSGKLYVYALIDGEWVFEQDLTREDAYNGDRFASRFAFEGDVIAVGAPSSGIGLLQHDSAVILFEKQEDGVWARTTTFDYDYHEGEFLGSGVDLHDGRLLIGAAGDAARMTHGIVYLYERDESGEWIVVDEETHDWPYEKDDSFARGVMLTEDTAFVSATNDDEAGHQAGAVYVYGLGCAADVNDDGTLDVLDFVAFQQRWQSKEADADCDDNGLFNVLDFVCFQSRFEAGCE